MRKYTERFMRDAAFPSYTRHVRLERALTVWALLGLAALVGIATWKLTLGERVIARGDLLLYFYPLRDYAAQAVREGRLPLWNPHTFMGAPFLANVQVGFFYPFNVLLSWVPTDRAVSWSIALHLLIAAWGAFVLARWALQLSNSASTATAIAFGLGGYLGAQAEHLNQLQGLAWLPWACAVVWRAERTGWGRAGLVLAPLLALQLFAGHAQSLYISLVVLGIVGLVAALTRWRAGDAKVRALAPLIALVLGGALAVLISAAQWMPALELARESARAGGLPFNEAASFSWRPWVIGRALLPTYGDPLFPEYVAYLGGVGLTLMLIGGLAALREHLRAWWLGLVLVGLGVVLALGVATPLFGVLYRWMPGFNLFRAQARWLVMFALGASLLVGLGVQRLQEGLAAGAVPKLVIAWISLVLGVIALIVLGVRLSPEAEYAVFPTRAVLLGWLLSAIAGAVCLAGGGVLGARAHGAAGRWAVALLSAELLVAAQFQPYARASDRQALTSLRPSTLFLRAHANDPNARVLALSSLFFDPGDKAEQELIYSAHLTADEVYDRLIASKHKEILSPNLALWYRLYSVDGYDGGLLPLRRYVAFVQRFAALPTGGLDGRLREFLSAVPSGDWLDAMAVRYVIADKTADRFFDGVYYDLLIAQPVSASLTLPLEPFRATALGLVFRAPEAQAGDLLARARLVFDDGSVLRFSVSAQRSEPPYWLARLAWGEDRLPVQLTLEPLRLGLVLNGVTSVDERDGSFWAQHVWGDRLRVVHSGDVKVYENTRAPSRFALQRRDGSLADLHALGGAVVVDAPERLVLRLPASADAARLIVRDACYPGWLANVDGALVSVECVDDLFRAVVLPPDARQVELVYQPISVRVGLGMSAVGGVLWGVGVAALMLRRRWRVKNAARGLSLFSP